ncbi:MAG TPA: hypothetical protein VK716_03305 [Terracidiphilus sp.]|nr:hypothetical protein [Terracidiphilus sp.]
MNGLESRFGVQLGRTALCFALVLFCGIQAAAPAGQESPSNGLNQRLNNPTNPFDTFSDQDPVFVAKQLRALNADRQKSMVSDTNRLVQLARELNAEAGNEAGEASMPDRFRKLAEIEKLARNVKQKMSFAGAGGPIVSPPFSGPLR